MELVTLDELLKKDINGKIICFPTDTVYGIGAKINDLKAIEKIYQMKHRDDKKPLAILCPSPNIDEYVDDISPIASELINKYWPGALTLIFKRGKAISKKVTRGLDTVGLRMPNSFIALQILKKFGLMATTSVNISGSNALNDITSITNQFANFIDYIVKDEATFSSVSSTVVDVTTSLPKVLRQGNIII